MTDKIDDWIASVSGYLYTGSSVGLLNSLTPELVVADNNSASAVADEPNEASDENSAVSEIIQYYLPSNTIVAQEKIILPSKTVMAQEKLSGDIVEQIMSDDVDIPPAIVEEINPAQITLPKRSPSLNPPKSIFSGGSSSKSFLADVIAPETTITSAPSAAMGTTTAVFVFESTENGSLYACQLDSASSTVCVSPKEYTNLSEGDHNFKVAATDASSNQDATSAEYSWTIDLSAPTLSNITSVPTRNSVVISWASDEAGLFQIEYGTSTSYGFLSATTSTSTLNLSSLASAARYHYRFLAQDSLGNATTTGDYNFETSSLADNVVVSEIQIGGATATDEFVELYNPTSVDINLSGWRLTKKSATGSTTSNLLTAFPDKIIPARGYFLIAHPTGYDGGVPADAVYSTTSSLAGDNTLILYSDAGHTIVDLIGLGTAVNSETATIANPPNNQSVERKSYATSTAVTLYSGEHKWQGNGYDTNNNSNDFVLQSIPAPQNSLMLIEPRNSLPNIMTASAWPAWQKNLTRTGLSSANSLASSTLNVKWIATTTATHEFSSRPILDDEGNIYLGRSDGLAKYSSGGEFSWLNSTSSANATPLIISDGTIYSRGSGGLFATASNGQFKWKYVLSGSAGINAAPAILSDGVIITQSAEKVIAINQDATQRWIFDPGRAIQNSNSISAFVVDSSDNIFVAIDDYIYKISAAGNLIWEKNLGSGYSSLALGPDDTLYVSSASLILGNYQGGFYALNVSDGSTKWSDIGSFNNHAELAPVVDPTGKVYVIMSYGGAWVFATKLQSYNATSTPSWASVSISTNFAAPILTSDGKIYVVDDKTLKIFNASDGALLVSFNVSGNGDLYTYFGAIGASGIIYTANTYTLYAIGDN